jgi:hypothetical protein
MKRFRLISSFYLAFIFFIAWHDAIAQFITHDAVYLHSGSIIRGKVLNSVVGKYVRIETVGRNVLVLAESDIERVVFDEPVPPDENNESMSSGFLAIADIGFLGGNDNNISLMLTNAWQFKNRLSTGAGFGMEKFDYQVLPVYADVRYNFLKSRITPFVNLQGGYSFPLGKSKEQNIYQQTDLKGGAMINPGVGLLVNLNTRNALVFCIGWRYQELRTKWHYDYNNYYPPENQSYLRTDFYRRIALRIGFIFN